MPNIKINRIGEIHKNRYGNEFTIIKYNNVNDITIRFSNGYVKEKVQYSNIKKGRVSSPYDKTVCNIGYIGEGIAPITINNNKMSEPYAFWNNMIKRCYGKTSDKYKHAYENKIVCDEWLNYNTFYKWYKNNYYSVDNEEMQLDKDILIKGNEIYGAETCVFVPKYINTLFTKCNKVRGQHPIGVTFINKKYISHVSKKGKNINIGKFKTEQEAFEKYKIEKEKFIKQVADEYKNRIPKKLYNAMYRYEVEITD